MDCASSIIKYILYLMNIIFVICGILLIVLGSVILSHMGEFKSFDATVNTQTIPILIIALGCVIFVISFFGCCGAIRENGCCMYTYATFMFILFGLQLALSVWIFTKHGEFINTMEKVVQEAFNKNDQANGSPMDALQMSFKCCGVKNYLDYTSTGKEVPKSCCGSLTNACPAAVYVTRPGCNEEFKTFWNHNINIISWAGIGVALFELIIFAFACCLASQMRRSRGHNF